MSKVPAELDTSVNRRVLEYLQETSAHSDVAEAMRNAFQSLGDVQFYCPDWQAYRYVVASTQGVVIGFATGMDTIGFRLDDCLRSRALACGAEPWPRCGEGWVSFTLFRDDWPQVDLEFWARKAYVAVREGTGARF